jgi:ATP/maltotriose-dependent transcriptional regulator MalT
MDELERGRQHFAGGAWREAHEALSRADTEAPLGPGDLELLATSAYMLGLESDYYGTLERAHRAHLDAGEELAGARAAFWIGVNLAQQGEMARASGWLGRAERLVESSGDDCAERGYLLIPVIFQHQAAADWEAAVATASTAAEVGERFGDHDLFALAVNMQGHMLIRGGRIEEGLRLLDEAMVAVTAGELSPIVTGIVYCGVILACQDAYELRRAQEWTTALTRWCEQQPDLVAFTGRCLVHRAELLQLRGEWPDALEEAQRAEERSTQGNNLKAAGEAAYLQGELHRLRGELAPARDAFRVASRCGREPQPGLALLRLAEGRSDAAVAAINRALREATERHERAQLLAAAVEIMLATGDSASARSACGELETIAAEGGRPMLDAIAASARGAIELDAGEAAAALVALRRGWQLWQDLAAPYEAARARELVGLACGQLGDADAAALELEAARDTFAELEAKPDLERIESLALAPGRREAHGLTERELEVLSHLAAGRSNREIAAKLVISEHTVARHVQNIFAKLGVSSRTAATAYAFEHDLA